MRSWGRWLHVVGQDELLFPRTGLFLMRDPYRPRLEGVRVVLGVVWPKPRLFLCNYENTVRWGKPMLWATAELVWGWHEYWPANGTLEGRRRRRLRFRLFRAAGVSPIVAESADIARSRRVNYCPERP